LYQADFEKVTQSCAAAIAFVKGTVSCAACDPSSGSKLSAKVNIINGTHLSSMMTDCTAMIYYLGEYQKIYVLLQTYKKTVNDSGVNPVNGSEGLESWSLTNNNAECTDETSPAPARRLSIKDCRKDCKINFQSLKGYKKCKTICLNTGKEKQTIKDCKKHCKNKYAKVKGSKGYKKCITQNCLKKHRNLQAVVATPTATTSTTGTASGSTGASATVTAPTVAVTTPTVPSVTGTVSGSTTTPSTTATGTTAATSTTTPSTPATSTITGGDKWNFWSTGTAVTWNHSGKATAGCLATPSMKWLARETIFGDSLVNMYALFSAQFNAVLKVFQLFVMPLVLKFGVISMEQHPLHSL